MLLVNYDLFKIWKRDKVWENWKRGKKFQVILTLPSSSDTDSQADEAFLLLSSWQWQRVLQNRTNYSNEV